MKSNTITLILLALFTLASSCSKSGGGGNNTANNTPALTDWYEYREDDSNPSSCTTNRHEFTNRNDMCIALQDYQKNNNNCAQNKRMQRFQTDCQGMTFNTSNYPANTSTTSGQGQYFYYFNGFNCSTYKTFNTLKEYCNGLIDNAFNNNCAEEARKYYHALYSCSTVN